MRRSKSNRMKTLVLGLALFTCAVGVYSFNDRHDLGSDALNPKYSAKHEFPSNKITTLVIAIQEKIGNAGTHLSDNILTLALVGFSKLNAQERLSKDSILTIIDYTMSSKEKRMYVIDLKSKRLLFNNVVAHGRNTGEEYAKQFSNQLNSHKSSLGFFVTQSTYKGSNGYSLALEGVDKGFNDMARKRAIVMHGAPYASETIIKTKGYLGRSYGCPTLPPQLNEKVIKKIMGGNCIFAYYPDAKYLNESTLLNG